MRLWITRDIHRTRTETECKCKLHHGSGTGGGGRMTLKVTERDKKILNDAGNCSRYPWPDNRRSYAACGGYPGTQ